MSLRDVPQTAKKYLEKALKLRAHDVQLMFQAAEIYVILGMEDKAIFYLKMAIENGCSIKKIMASPEIKKLKSNEQFQSLLDKYQSKNN